MFYDYELGCCSITKTTPSGPVEHTDLTDIDRAVASFLQGIIQTWQCTDRNRKENKEFIQFLDREPETKLYVGLFDSHVDFLQKLASRTQKKSKSLDEEGAAKMLRNNMLPVLYVGRDLTFTYSETGDHRDETWSQDLVAEVDGVQTVIGKVNKSYPLLTYNINVLAWEKSTISRICTGLTMWLRHTKIGRKHVFKARTQICGAPYELNVEVRGARDVTGFPVEIDMKTDKLWGQTFSIEFVSEFVEVEAVEQQKGRVVVKQELMP